MAILDAPVACRTALRSASPLRDVAVACGCGIACAACAGVAWAGGLWLAELLFGWRTELASRPDQLPHATLAMTGIGALAGFVASAAMWIARTRLARTGVLVIVGCTLTGALAGALTPATVVACAPRLTAHLASSLAWAVAGFLAGFLGYQLSLRSANGESAATIAVWAVAPALLTGTVWGIALTIDQYLTAENFARALAAGWEFDAFLALTARGALVGLGVGTALSLVLVGGDRGFGHRAATAVAWGGRLGIATALGAAFSALAVLAVGGVIAPEVSSAVGFATAGLVAGLSASGKSRANTPPQDWDAIDEEHTEPPGAGIADSPARVVSARMRSALRLLPVGIVALGSLIAAAILAPDPPALALLAIGLLGLAVIPILWNQEGRLRALERRTDSPKRD